MSAHKLILSNHKLVNFLIIHITFLLLEFRERFPKLFFIWPLWKKKKTMAPPTRFLKKPPLNTPF